MIKTLSVDEASLQSREDMRAYLDQINAEHGGTDFYILVKEEQAIDIASGYVPNSVKAQVRAMLDWQDEDRRRAERPVKPSKERNTVRKGKT